MQIQRIVFPNPGCVKIENSEIPSTSHKMVLVKSEYSLVSNGTERIVFERGFEAGSYWDQWVRYPFLPGYATVGTIIQTGSIESIWKVGQRVAIRSPHASHHLLREDLCIPIPDGVSFENAVWFALAKIGFLGAWVSKLKSDNSVLIVGGGLIAQMVMRWISTYRTAVIAILTRNSFQFEASKSGGATVLMQGNATDYSATKIQDCIGTRPQLIIDCTSSPEVFAWALGVIADYGRVVLLGDPGAPSLRSLTSDVMVRGITITGTHDHNTYGRWNNHNISNIFFDEIIAGRFTMNRLCTHNVLPQESSHVYALLTGPIRNFLGIRFDWRSEGKR
jgi:threonine dehydrogenase-like Zn-dependent dehydrogenase